MADTEEFFATNHLDDRYTSAILPDQRQVERDSEPFGVFINELAKQGLVVVRGVLHNQRTGTIWHHRLIISQLAKQEERGT